MRGPNEESGETTQGVPYRTLGRTGEKVSLVGVGGAHIGRVSEKESLQIIRASLDRGL